MLDSVQQARCVSVHEANEIRNKLLNLTSQRGRSRFSHMIMPLPGNVRGVGQIGEYIEIMLEAMYLHKKIQFQYTEINNAMEKVLRKEGKMYQLNLYTIYWSDNNYYLIGSHDNHDGLTNYRLDRIENMSMSSEETIPAEEKIGVNPELVIQDYIKKSVNHFSGNTIRIEVEYKPAPITMLYYMNHDYDKVLKNRIHDKSVPVRDTYQQLKTAQKKKDEVVQYKLGDAVTHPKFGHGIVEKINQRSGGVHLHIRFDGEVKCIDQKWLSRKKYT